MTSSFFQPDKPDAKPVSQTVIEVALQRAVTNIKNCEQNGWWSYVQEKGPSIEATGWCTLALYASSPDVSRSQKSLDFLLKKQNYDGGWSTAPSCGPSDWSTAPAVLCLRLLLSQQPRQSRSAIEHSIVRGTNFLFGLRSDPYHSVARFLFFLLHGEDGLHYGRGWPWNKDCAFWVEPTCYSLLALKLPHVPDRTVIRSSIKHAQKYLHQHVCLAGGWNHGADFVLNFHAPPYTVTTAEALLALQDEPRSPIIQRALQIVAGNNPDSNSSMTLAWSILALHAYGSELGDKPAKLIAHQNANGSFGPDNNNMITAIAILALLAAGRNTNLLKI